MQALLRQFLCMRWQSVNKFMQEAIVEANKASLCGEVPVGAIIVNDGKIIARAHNLVETNNNPMHHAEILVIDKALKLLKTKNLKGCELYVTLEPCAMCIGACALSKIDKVYFGAYDTKSGACGGKTDVMREKCFDYKTEVYGGIEETECKKILADFFIKMREGK